MKLLARYYAAPCVAMVCFVLLPFVANCWSNNKNIKHEMNRRSALETVSFSFLGGVGIVTIAPTTVMAATLDVNNALAREYTAFPGLYPTIATKLVNRAKEQPFTSKSQVYAALGSDVERERLKQYDSSIKISKVDKNLQQFKTSQICKYECGSRVSNSYRDEQIKAVQAARR